MTAGRTWRWAMAFTLALGTLVPASQGCPPVPDVDDAPPGPEAPIERPPYDPQAARRTVAFWEAKVLSDEKGAVAARELAAAYLRLHRETGDIADAVRAEAAARRSLAARGRGNAAALSRLSQALLAQHRFPEALEAADRAAMEDAQAQRLRSDILLELGDLPAAERALEGLPPADPSDPNHLALRARIREAKGDEEGALRLRREAARRAEALFDLPHESVAWYRTMVGHALIDRGKLDEGERACRSALEVFPLDYRAMTGLAEAAAWRRDWDGAVAWGRKALAACPQNPEVLRLLGDAHAERGDTQEAERHYRLLKRLARSFPRIYDRHWALFCADTGRDLDEALALARKDLELRQDTHAYDTLAWVCFKKGLLREAGATMAKALARGTHAQDASLFYHAGLIARAGGDRAKADEYLARARSLNPHLPEPDAEPAARRD